MTQTDQASTLVDDLPWRVRLFQIFVSQKFVMFMTSLVFIFLALPSDSRANPTITAFTVFGGMKAMDYVRSVLSKGSSNGS